MKSIEESMDPHYLVVDQNQTIHGLQREFNKVFPFLKLELFRDDIKKGIRDPKNLIITADEKLSGIQKKNHSGKIAFGQSTTVNELENSFLTGFGLYVQVFRKSGNIWLVTTSTDDWTLEQQNEEGRSIAQHLNIEAEDPNDHDVY